MLTLITTMLVLFKDGMWEWDKGMDRLIFAPDILKEERERIHVLTNLDKHIY